MLNFLRSDVHQMVLEVVQIFLIQQLQDNKTYQTAVEFFCFFWSFYFFFAQFKSVVWVFKYYTPDCQHITGA